MSHKRDDKLFNYLKAKSPILDSKNRSHMDSCVWQFADVRGLSGLITELEGSQTRAAELLATIDAEFENQKVRARRLGKVEPTEIPQDLAKEQLEAQARADVIALELAFVREKLVEAEARIAAAADDKVLMYGPIGSGRCEPLVEIDGQAVKADDEGILRINCKKSPYNGMRICDYREMVCKPFQAWQRRPLTPEERALGPAAPIRGGGCTVEWKDLPARPEGF